MYRDYYGLAKKPFELAPVGGLVYLSESHLEAISMLRYGVVSDKGFVLLTGGVGTGKTTVLNTLLGVLKKRVRYCVLNNPKLTRHDFFFYLGRKVGIPYRGNKGHFILRFTKMLDQLEARGEKFLLIVDEAQVFPIDLLEEVRLLSNHAESKNVMGIFLLGQPELRDILAHPRLLPLRQRIGTHYHLEPFSYEDTRQYIGYRLRMAEAKRRDLFHEEALELIFDASRGNPRLINIICDQALMTGFSEGKPVIDADTVYQVLEEVQLEGEDLYELSPAGSAFSLGRSRLAGPRVEPPEVTESGEKSGLRGSKTNAGMKAPISTAKVLLIGGVLLAGVVVSVVFLIMRALEST
ncbi:AAA family ATPase [candidate division KSB3 bacterium]|nr:MAG: AAA family ATPase [candidate division KSB3 bacterium]